MSLGATFRELEADAHLEIQEHFADELLWQFVPMVIKPNFPPQPDSSRKSVDVQGVFSWRSKDVAIGLEEMKVSSRDPYLTIHANCCPPDIRRGDQFWRRDQPSIFEVVQTQKDGYSGVDVLLMQIGRQF